MADGVLESPAVVAVERYRVTFPRERALNQILRLRSDAPYRVATPDPEGEADNVPEYFHVIEASSPAEQAIAALAPQSSNPLPHR
nr:hypothetical protein [uncultured Pseudomonas sp.]